ncbi:hypothetical protein L1D14_04430 [Vibrio tubiashii]|uniref:hypothetical protein n=1 Tax=Vibrio tubiashii TaxID=29498 RepID=UPI001EFCCD78|nr:hypothetical protein [Vibrio tubiashii]MCG9575479.1 hypothetical protein [Vibrio tubiashii]
MDLTVISSMSINAIEHAQQIAALDKVLIEDAVCPFEPNSPEAHVWENTDVVVTIN